MTQYKSSAVRALVELHREHMEEFVQTWGRAKAADVVLPDTSDPDYNSLEHVLRHALGASAGELSWICEQLQLPDPELKATPELDRLEAEADGYLEYLMGRWQEVLAGVQDHQLGPESYMASWQAPYCIDAMLEHAVMHPIRHSHQLKRLMRQ